MAIRTMQLNRGSLLKGVDGKLGISFWDGESRSDVYSITKVEIYNPSVTLVNTITNVTRVQQGDYQVIVPGSTFSVSGNYQDWWYIKYSETSPTQIVTQLSPVANVTDTYSQNPIAYLIKFVRIILGDNNPHRYRRNPHMDGVDQFATTPNLDPYGLSYKWSDDELHQMLLLSMDYINFTWGINMSWSITNFPNKYLLIRGAEILAVRAKGTTELNESFELSDGGASLTLSRFSSWHSQADQLEQKWSEEVKMYKMKFRPRPVGTATASGPFLLGSLVDSVTEYMSFYYYHGFGRFN